MAVLFSIFAAIRYNYLHQSRNVPHTTYGGVMKIQDLKYVLLLILITWTILCAFWGMHKIVVSTVYEESYPRPARKDFLKPVGMNLFSLIIEAFHCSQSYLPQKKILRTLSPTIFGAFFHAMLSTKFDRPSTIT